MKKLLFGLLIVFWAFLTFMPNQGSAQTSDDAVVSWMYDNGLTMFDNKEDFWWDRPVTRGEIAKFFTQFAIVYGKQKTKDASECQFNDIEGYDYTLVPNIIEACEYGLMKWSNGNYFPNNNITLAEWLTVIIRTIDGMQDETGNPWWRETYNSAQWLGILDNESVWDLDQQATRGQIWLWIYRANLAPVDGLVREWSQKIKEIMTEVFWEDFWDEI